MKISVILAAYNGEEYIVELLKSITEQSRTPDEIVIADDNSKDNTFITVTDFIDDNAIKNRIEFKLYKNENNLGFAKNFRNAISKATGDIIVLADQDDIFVKNKLEKIENYFSVHAKAAVFISAFRMIDESGKIISSTKPFSNDKTVSFEELIKGNSYPGCTIAFKSNLISFFNYFDDSVFTHDWFVLIVASLFNPNSIFYTKESLVLYRMHSSNTLGVNLKNEIRFSINERIDGISKTIKFLDKIIEILKNQSNFENQIERLIKQNLFNKNRIKYLEKEGSLIAILRDFNKIQNSKMLLGDLIYRFKKS